MSGTTAATGMISDAWTLPARSHDPRDPAGWDCEFAGGGGENTATAADCSVLVRPWVNVTASAETDAGAPLV